MPAPRHPRHLPATLSLSPYHPHPPPNSLAYSTRSPRSTSPPYSTATYAPHHPLPPPLHTLPLYMHLPRSPAAHCDPILNSPLLPFRTASHPSSARTHPILSTSQTSFYTPSPPLSRVPSEPPSAEKFALPRLKQAVTHLWKSFGPKEEEHLSSTSYPDDIVWITLWVALCIAKRKLDL